MSSNLRDAAESTLHTVAEFVDDTIHTLQKVELPSLSSLPSLPSLPGRKSGPSLMARAIGVAAAGALLVAAVVMISRRGRSTATDSEPKATDTQNTDSAVTTAANAGRGGSHIAAAD